MVNDAPPPPAAISKSYLQVPAAYDPLRAQAESVAAGAGATTPFEKAVALQNWLSDGTFKYTLKAPTVLSASGLATFLERTKSGYCQQFSYAMAVLARLLGIPSRVAYGFTSGTPDGTDSWQVTTHDAHAWPELYFQGLGWLRFEPTPAGANGQGTAYAPTYAYLPNGSFGGTTHPEPTSAPTAGGNGSKTGHPSNIRSALGEGNPGHNTGDNAAPARAPGVNPWEVFGLVLAGLAVVGLAAPWTARQVIRRRRWRRRGGGRDGRGRGQPVGLGRRDVEWAHAAWDELRDDLLDYGAGGLPSESPRAVASRAGTELALARASPGRARPHRHGGGTGQVLRAARQRLRPAAGQRHGAAGHRRRRAPPGQVARQAAAGLGDRARPERDCAGGRHLQPPDAGLAWPVPDRGFLAAAALLPPAPALIKPLHHGGAGSLATAAPAAVPRTP